jgi:hypothetical protein
VPTCQRTPVRGGLAGEPGRPGSAVLLLARINEQGQIAEHRGVVDTIGTMGQLGLLPAPDQAAA